MDKVSELQFICKDLYLLCEKVCDSLRKKTDIHVFLKIAHTFVLKAKRTLKAVNILFDEGLSEQAQALVRILFELRLNFDCFLHMSSKDQKLTCFRIIDAMMLEKIKQQKASHYAGLEMIPNGPQKADFEKLEKEIASRYSIEDLKKIKKYGFTGLPIEQRAILTGHEDMYNIIYRNFSRNIHSTDYAEHYMLQGYFDEERMLDYYKSRDIVTLQTAIFSAGGIAQFASLSFKCGLDDELKAIALRKEAIDDVKVT